MPKKTLDHLTESMYYVLMALVPGDSFGCPGFFRIAYCVPTEKVERSLEAFRKLAKEYED